MAKRKGGKPPAPMRVIVVASRKGGVGKTTLAVNLAVEAERAGAGPVGVVDADSQLSLAKWWDKREANEPALARPLPDLAAALADLREQGCRLAFVDTPPAATADIADMIQLADLVLVPVQPSPDDLRSVGITVDLIEASLAHFCFILNRVKPRVRLTGEAAIALSQHGKVAPVQVADRTLYAASKIDGRTAAEWAPDGPAAAEMAELWRYVADQLTRAVRLLGRGK